MKRSFLALALLTGPASAKTAMDLMAAQDPVVFETPLPVKDIASCIAAQTPDPLTTVPLETGIRLIASGSVAWFDLIPQPSGTRIDLRTIRLLRGSMREKIRKCIGADPAK